MTKTKNWISGLLKNKHTKILSILLIAITSITWLASLGSAQRKNIKEFHELLANEMKQAHCIPPRTAFELPENREKYFFFYLYGLTENSPIHENILIIQSPECKNAFINALMHSKSNKNIIFYNPNGSISFSLRKTQNQGG